jgi:predicted DNA binding CopG/RHH family protein
LQLITGQSTITLAHRCDSVQGVMGWLPKEAAREVLFAKKARKVGRPRLVNKAKSVTKTFILAEEVASKIEIVAAENGLTFSKYVRKVLENHIEKGV